MTLRKLWTKEHGEKGWKRLSPRLKKLFLRIDETNKGQRPVTHRELREAFSR